MCGILGWINQGRAVSPDTFSGALCRLNRRGPDFQATYHHESVSLGHARLSIVDLSTAANQPFFDSTGRYVIIFNGEIFNYQELRSDLQQAGIILKTHSDTEVLLQLFIQYGETCLARLNGFFAFAVYDHQTQEVFLARDRFGIKPLKYYREDSCFVFASEMKALLALSLPKQLNPDAVNLYFQYNYLPPGVSMLQGYGQLLPGECLWVRGKDISVTQWYQLPKKVSQNYSGISYQEAQKQVVTLLEDAVQKRLIADVPVGVFLSGGIDSSIVTALAARNQQNLHTFSISFDNPLYDERQYALAVAKKYHTEHTIFEVTENELFASLSDVLDYLDEPFADSSALNFYLLSKQTRRRITVALSGDGADEVFAGYSKHVGLLNASQKSFLNQLLRLSSPLLKSLPANRNTFLGRVLYQAAKYAQGLDLSAQERYLAWCRVMAWPEVNTLLQPKFHRQTAEIITKPPLFIPTNPDFNDLLAADVQLVLAGDMLVKADLMSMANSLEVRVPFLDYRVVDFAFSLPATYKIQGTHRKRILQDAFREWMPPELYNRPKQGFEVPLRSWFLGCYRETIETNILNRHVIEQQGVFRHNALESLWQRILRGQNTKEDWTLWAVIVFQHWYQRYFTLG